MKIKSVKLKGEVDIVRCSSETSHGKIEDTRVLLLGVEFDSPVVVGRHKRYLYSILVFLAHCAPKGRSARWKLTDFQFLLIDGRHEQFELGYPSAEEVDRRIESLLEEKLIGKDGNLLFPQLELVQS